jgi:hypothetical protein
LYGIDMQQSRGVSAAIMCCPALGTS